jgi:alpha-beta hydrolase superfamily lysophospholipase
MQKIEIAHLAAWQHTVSNPKARVLIVHGISEHSNRHQNTIQALLKNDIEVIRFDLRGAGESEGARQYIESFEDYVKDVEHIFNWQKTLKPLPLFLLGHSLGGAIAIHFFPRHQEHFKGLMLTAPAYKVGGSISPLKIAIGKALVGFVPKLKLPVIRKKATVSRIPEVEKAFRSDPLVSHFNTLQQGNEILKALEQIIEKSSLIEKPTFIAHGTSDVVILAVGSYEILRALKSSDKELHYFPLAFHELHNDLCQEEFLRLLNHWIDNRLVKT